MERVRLGPRVVDVIMDLRARLEAGDMRIKVFKGNSPRPDEIQRGENEARHDGSCCSHAKRRPRVRRG